MNNIKVIEGDFKASSAQFALVVARWTGDLDMQQLHARLDHQSWEETDDPEALVNAQQEHMAGDGR